MTPAKAAIVVLVLFAILFAVGIGSGMREDGAAISVPDWVGNLSSAFSPRVDFSSLTLSGECTAQAGSAFVLKSGAICVVSIPPDETATRSLKLELVEGVVEVIYDAPNGEGRPSNEDKLEFRTLRKGKRESLTVAVLAGGGELTLTCKRDTGPRTVCKVEIE